MYTVGLGLIGATVIIMIFQNTATAILIGRQAPAGQLLALLMRVGGGIFTKAADVARKADCRQGSSRASPGR